MGADMGEQFTVAVVFGTAADRYAADAVRIGDVTCVAREFPDFLRHVACCGVAAQPFDVPAQKPGQRADVPGRGLQPSFVGDEAGPGCQDRTDGRSHLGGCRIHRVAGGALPGGFPDDAHHVRARALVAVGVQGGQIQQFARQTVMTRQAQEPAVASFSRSLFSASAGPGTTTIASHPQSPFPRTVPAHHRGFVPCFPGARDSRRNGDLSSQRTARSCARKCGPSWEDAEADVKSDRNG